MKTRHFSTRSWLIILAAAFLTTSTPQAMAESCVEAAAAEVAARDALKSSGCYARKNRNRPDCQRLYRIVEAKKTYRRQCRGVLSTGRTAVFSRGGNPTSREAARVGRAIDTFIGSAVRDSRTARGPKTTGACPPGMKRSPQNPNCHCPEYNPNCRASSGAPGNAGTLMNDFLGDGTGFFAGPFSAPW